MSQQLISLSPDLKKLRDEGYSLQILGGYLLIHQVPYVTSSKQVKKGTLVSQLTLSNNTTTTKPNTHVVYFAGEFPCYHDGKPIAGIAHASNTQELYKGVTVNHSFSNKPPNGYIDFYEKMSTYATILSSQAKALDNRVTEKTFELIPDDEGDTPFQYMDTSSSRSNIASLTSKFKDQKIAIIGLGGTGGYILDLISKTPVKEVHLYDGDYFLQHNAFRSPGAATSESLNKKMKKVEYYRNVYSSIHKGIIAHDCYVYEKNVGELADMTFVFICVDNDAARKDIIKCLLSIKVPFIDVGLGVNRVDEALIGILRVTVGTNLKNDHLPHRISYGEDDNNEYATNIQIADLNSLNAVLAVIKWKKISGFYQDLQGEHHSTYSINISQLLNEDTTA